MQEVFAAVDAFNQDLQAEGSWVFAGGLEPPSSATVVDATGPEVLVTDGPVRRGQGAARWLLGRRGPDLDAALEIARRGSAACTGAVEVRPFQGE